MTAPTAFAGLLALAAGVQLGASDARAAPEARQNREVLLGVQLQLKTAATGARAGGALGNTVA